MRKSKMQSKLKNILNYFVNNAPDRKEDVYGHHIETNTYTSLSKKHLINRISCQMTNQYEAIQIFPKATGSSNARYVIKYTKAHQQYNKLFIISEDTIKSYKLNSHIHSAFMLETCKEVIQVIERNSLKTDFNNQKHIYKIQEITLLFVEDSNQKL